jgi:archaemetzincin
VKVRIVVLGAAPPGLAAAVLASLPSPLVAAAMERRKTPEATCYSRRRGQLDALCVLDNLPAPAEGEVVAAVTAIDLFAPPLAYVFGLSVLGSRRSVVSWARLAVEDGKDPGLLIRRLTTEVVHEVGHGLGLVHCPVPDCAMHRSFWAEAVDLKRPVYCRLCQEGLEKL